MSDLEGYGKIYDTTYWGVGRDNTISWGIVYANLGSIAPQLVSAFKTRVEADGGSVENTACLTTDVEFLTKNPEPVAFTGLLNEYSGAAAAYSLRLLDSTYSGNAIKVRRASDNTEQDIGFVNNVLDTSSLETFCSGTDGFVTTWYDQSGNANNATQSTAARQPKIVSSGSTILEGGKPILESNSSTMLLPISFQNVRYKIFSVSKSVNSFVTFGVEGENVYQLIGVSGQTSTLISTAVTNNSMRVNSTSFSPINRGAVYSALSIHNVLYNDTSFQASLANSLLGYTGAIFGMMRSSEYVFYNDTFNDSNISGVETNINDYYSIY